MVAEVVVGYLVRWAVERARPAGRRVNEGVDGAIAVGVDRLHAAVVARLGPHPALVRLEQDAAAGRNSETAAAWATEPLRDALEHDPDFRRQIDSLLAQLRDLEAQVEVRQPAGRDAVHHSGGPGSVTAANSTVATGRGKVAGDRSQIGHRFGAFGAVAVVLIITLGFVYYLGTKDGDGSSAEVEAYQRRVVATCEQVNGIMTADHSGDVIVLDASRANVSDPGSLARVRKGPLLAVLNNNTAQVRTAMAQLSRISPPAELAARKRAVDGANARNAAKQKQAIAAVGATVRDGMTLSELQRLNFQLPGSTGDVDVSGTELNGALSDLAGQPCTAV